MHAPGTLLTAVSERASGGYVASNGTSGAAALVSGLLARSVKDKGATAAAAWLADASAPAIYWRKGKTPKDGQDMLLAQARPLWRKLCRLNAEASMPGGSEGWLSSGTPVRPALSALGASAPCEAAR